MRKLAENRCVPCRGGQPPLTDAQIVELRLEVPEWNLVEQNSIFRLQRVFRCKDFAAALQITNMVGALAEQEDHHPLIVTEWGRVTVQWWTHTIKGLHRNDFIMAAKTDVMFHALAR